MKRDRQTEGRVKDERSEGGGKEGKREEGAGRGMGTMTGWKQQGRKEGDRKGLEEKR